MLQSCSTGLERQLISMLPALLDIFGMRQEIARCHQDAYVSRQSHARGHRRIEAPQHFLHPPSRCDERLRHLLGLQVAGAEGEASHLSGKDRSKFESVATN